MEEKGFGRLIKAEYSSLLFGKMWELAAVAGGALLVFPLFPIAAYVIAAAVIIALITRLRRPFSWRFILIVIAIMGAISAANVAVLTFSDQTKFVVATDDLIGASMVEEVQGPVGPLWIVPVSPLKRWLFRALSRYDDSFVLLDAVRTPAGYTIVSPTELALARLDSPDGVTRRRSIAIPYRNRQLMMLFREGESGGAQFTLNVYSGSNQLTLSTDVGPNAPGLFGLHSETTPTSEIWRRVAFGDELLRNLSRLEIDRIIDLLEQEAARTGDMRDFVRLTVFRLELVADAYTSPMNAGRISVFGPSAVGNLRWIGARFRDRLPETVAFDDAWGVTLQFSALKYLNAISAEMQSLPAGVDSGEDWIIGLLRQASGQSPPGGGGSDPATEERQSEADREEAAILDRMAAQMRSGTVNFQTWMSDLQQLGQTMRPRDDPLAEGDRAALRNLRMANEDLLRPEVRQWIRAVPARAPARSFLVYTALQDKCGEPFARLFETPPGPEIARQLSTRVRAACAPLASVLELFDDPLQRRMIANDLAISQPIITATISGQQLLNCANAGGENAEALCFVSYMMLMAQDYQPYLRPVLEAMARDCGPQCGGVALYERRLPTMGTPYSAQEFFYGLYVIWALADESRPDLSVPLCQSVERDFSEVMEEGRLLDRLVVLNLQLAIFKRCESPSAAIVTRVLHNNRLPTARWQRFVEREFLF